MSSTPCGHYPRKTVRDAPPPRQGRQAAYAHELPQPDFFRKQRPRSPRRCPSMVLTPRRLLFSCLSCVSWFNPFLPLRGSVFFRVFVCFVVLKILFVPLRVHSWFLVFSVPLRGSVFFSCLSCVSWFNPLLPLRGFEITIRAPSCPLVVLRFFRAPSWFCFFPCPFVVQSPLSPWP